MCMDLQRVHSCVDCSTSSGDPSVEPFLISTAHRTCSRTFCQRLTLFVRWFCLSVHVGF